MYRQKRKAPSAHEELQSARRSLQDRLTAVSAGPLYARTHAPGAGAADQFRQSFEQLGRARTEKASGRKNEAETQPGQTDDEQQQKAAAPGADGKQTAPERSKGIPSKPLPLQRFSDLAFRRGNLSGAILQGTGKMMLISCLRRTVNPRRPVPHKELGPEVKRSPFSGHDPDTQVFMRDLARGAVSIVVDTLHDAHRTLQMMQEAVQSGGPGAEQLFSMYPFLDDSGEREQLAEYREALLGAGDPDTRALLQNAIVHVESSIAEKARMRMDFLTALRGITKRARQAIEEFEAEGVEEEIAKEVEEDIPEEPPADGSGRGEDDDALPEEPYDPRRREDDDPLSGQPPEEPPGGNPRR